MINLNKYKDKLNEKFWNEIEKFQNVFGYGDEITAKLMRIDLNEFKEKRLNNQSILATHLLYFSHELKLDSLKVFNGRVDWEVAKKQYEGDSSAMPKRHFLNPNSKAFTFLNILEEVESLIPQYTPHLLESLQIKKLDLLADPNKPISVNLPAELLRLAKLHIHKDYFYKWGLKNALQHKDGLFGKTLQKARSAKELFDMWLPLEKYLETNWKYDISYNDGETVLINGHPTEEMMEFHKRKDYGNQEFNWFRAGFLPGLLYYIGLTGANVTFTKSIHQGDECDQFHVDLSQLKPLSSPRPAHSLH